MRLKILLDRPCIYRRYADKPEGRRVPFLLNFEVMCGAAIGELVMGDPALLCIP